MADSESREVEASTQSPGSESHPRLAEIVGVFARITSLTFGGGNPTVAALQRELVNRRKWLDASQYSLCYALARLTPGTNLFAFCTAAGWLLGRWKGTLATVLVASIPCCVLVWLVTTSFDSLQRYPAVRIAIGGAMAASVGILLANFWLLVQPHLTRREWIRSSFIVLSSILLSFYADLSPVMVLLVSAFIGMLWRDEATG